MAGNGCIGANVYGGVKEETTMITHGDLWHNGCQDSLPDVSANFKKQRNMMDAEQFKEASWEIANALKEKGYQSVLESQLPVADFNVIIQPIKGFSEYIRGIHMDTGEVGCEWRDGDSFRTSYLFVSRTRDVIVKRITSTVPNLDMTLGMDIHYNTTRDSAEKYAKHVLETKECSAQTGWSMAHMAAIYARFEDGENAFACFVGRTSKGKRKRFQICKWDIKYEMGCLQEQFFCYLKVGEKVQCMDAIAKGVFRV